MSGRALKSAFAAATIAVGLGLFSEAAMALPTQPGVAAAIGQNVAPAAELVRHRSWHRPRPIYRKVRVCRTNWYHGRKITRCHWETRRVWRR